ncbi:hypothetical protein OAQ80_03070 [Flavobacteriaceae bacterium]|nr:hypothetical protein [Flavobacteriaceae bacterium]
MFSIRIPLFVFIFLLLKTVLSQQIEATGIEAKEFDQEFNQAHRDTLKANKKNSLDKKVKQISSKGNKKPLNKKPPKKRLIPFIKPMDDVSIGDYKILYFDGSEKVVDTSLSIEGEYTFNFLRKDYFEYLTFPNMGEAFNKMGYNFHEQPLTPQMGARVKHFGYFEKEDVPYYEVPSPYTELFFKSTFQQGQNLDATLAINTSPKFNIAVSFKGFRSLGKYLASLSRARQFRISSQYQNYNKRYRMRLHQTTQSLQNQVNGGLTNDSDYFFQNAPNYISADESGNPILDENGNEQIVFYDGFLDRNRLNTHLEADNILKGKRYFMEHRYQLFPIKKDSTVYKMSVGFRTSIENKIYQYNQDRPGKYFNETYENSVVDDSITFNSLENNLFLNLKDKTLGQLNLDLYHYNWNYSIGPNDYEKDTILSNEIKASQIAAQVSWEKEFFGITSQALVYQSFKNEYSTQALRVNLSRPLIKDIILGASYEYRSQPLNFNFYLLQSDFREYNWENSLLENQNFKTQSIFLSHPKWGRIMGELTSINNYTFFNNTTRLTDLNEKFKVEVLQIDKKIDYIKVRLDNRLDFGNFSWVNNIQYQKVNQEENTDELLSGPFALNVPEWLIRSTFMLTSSIFNKALFFQSGFTFVFFTDYYADQYNPLLAEFVTQNNTKIGEYPRVDFFFNSKIKSSRIYLKLENISSPIEHLINVDTQYDYYAAPFVPYRDFSIRFGLIWNFFE